MATLLNATPEHGKYRLRPVVGADFDFLWQLKLDTLKQYIEPLFGWDEELAKRILRDRVMPEGCIVAVEGKDVGVLKVTLDDDWLTLREIGLVPSIQGRGLGTRLIRDVLAYADERRLPVELLVMKPNPARRLYERLGFEVSHFQMCRLPSQAV
jgi:GNAT superfamily N-acetyltransferase